MKYQLSDGNIYELYVFESLDYRYKNNLTKNDIKNILLNKINLISYNHYGIPFKIISNKYISEIHISWLEPNQNGSPATVVSEHGKFNDLLFTLTVNKVTKKIEVTPIEYIVAHTF